MGVLDLIFPITCLECGKNGKYVCEECLLKVRKAKTLCLYCYRFSQSGETHLKCKKKESIDYTFSVWEYGGIVRKAILKIKYNFAYKIAEELAEKLVERLKKEIAILPNNAILTPVPLYRQRTNWRGFNQSEVMGKIVADKMGWKNKQNLLKRIRKTIPQAELKGKERTQNIIGAFSLTAENLESDGTYILFDDVLTTGSTLKEACKVLKQKGAKTVFGLTIAA